MDEILTIKEVSDYLKLSRTTVWRWCKTGKIPAFKVGRSWRVRKAEVEKFLEYSTITDDRSSELKAEKQETHA